MKIKIFQSYDQEKLTDLVNAFIETVKVVNIQLVVQPAPNTQHQHYIMLVQSEEN